MRRRSSEASRQVTYIFGIEISAHPPLPLYAKPEHAAVNKVEDCGTERVALWPRPKETVAHTSRRYGE